MDLRAPEPDRRWRPRHPAEANLVLSVPADSHLLDTTTPGEEGRLPVSGPWRVWLDVVRSGEVTGAEAVVHTQLDQRA